LALCGHFFCHLRSNEKLTSGHLPKPLYSTTNVRKIFKTAFTIAKIKHKIKQWMLFRCIIAWQTGI